MKIEIISGSPRTNSVSKRVALHLHQAMQQQEGIEAGLILMNETEVPPLQKVWSRPQDAPVHLQPLAQRMFDARGFILVTPEYNGSFSPALKNLLDHFPKQHRKAFGICTASDGALGGMRAAQQSIQLVAALFGILSPILLVVPAMDKKFDENGVLLDKAFEAKIKDFTNNFTWLAKRLQEPQP